MGVEYNLIDYERLIKQMLRYCYVNGEDYVGHQTFFGDHHTEIKIEDITVHLNQRTSETMLIINAIIIERNEHNWGSSSRYNVPLTIPEFDAIIKSDE